MKYSKNIILSIILSCITLFSSNIVVSAETQQSTVSADVESTFTVSVPKTIELSTGDNYSALAEYITYAQGDTEGGTSIYINPEQVFKLTERVSGEQIVCKVLQTKSEWCIEDLLQINAIEGKGYITTDGLSPGVYYGTFYFNIEKNDSMKKDIAPGLYSDSNYTTLVYSWDELISTGLITVVDGAITASDVSNIEGYLKIDNSVTSIGAQAFLDAHKLYGVKMSDNTVSVDTAAFCYCSELSDVVLNEGLSSIGNTAFARTKISEIILPNSLQTIGTQTFFDTDLVSVIIPSNVSSIGFGAFSMCENLESILVDSENKNYESVDGVLFDESIKTLITYPASKGLDTYNVPNTVNTIEIQSFAGTKHLKNLILGTNTSTINDSAMGYSSIENVYFPKKVRVLGEGIFVGSNNVKSIEVQEDSPYFTDVDGVLYNKTLTKLYYYPIAKSSSSYTMEPTVTEIMYGAFANNKTLEEINIASSVKTINAYAFYGIGVNSITLPKSLRTFYSSSFTSPSLKELKLEEGISGYYIDENGALCSTNKVLLVYPAGRDATEYTTNNKVTRIFNGAFAECNNLKSITVTNNVTAIDQYAFELCKNLTSVTLPSTVSELGVGTFYGCTSLDLTVPDTVTTIGDRAFYNVPHVTYNGSASGSPWGALSIN